MAERGELLMNKYLQLLGEATGEEIDNIRAKIAWILTEGFFKSIIEEEGVFQPITLNDFERFLDEILLKQFPFCEKMRIEKKDSENIIFTIQNCHLKIANEGFDIKGGNSLCPIDPFINFSYSRGLRQNIWLVDIKQTGTGCLMEFSLSNQCSLEK